MKVSIVKYLNPKGKVVEMRKDNFKGKDLPENIIEEYEVEIKGDNFYLKNIAFDLSGTWCIASKENINKLEELGHQLVGFKFEGDYVNIGRVFYTYKGEKTGRQIHLLNGRFEYVQEEDSNETDWLEDLKIKYATGNYISLVANVLGKDIEWIKVGDPLWVCDKYVLIHAKHKDILEAYLKNPSVEIETGMFAPMTGETEPSKWVKLEKDFIEDYNEEFWYRLKVKDLAWYEDKSNFPLILTDISNNVMYLETYPLNEGTKILIKTNNLRPATESEVLSLVYKPQQKISKEEILTESNRLKVLFLNDRAECLVENEQEFKLVYDFLDKNCDKKLDRYLEADGRFEYSTYNDEFPIILSTPSWGNIYEWDKLQDRDLSKPLIKFNGETFWEVFE